MQRYKLKTKRPNFKHLYVKDVLLFRPKSGTSRGKKYRFSFLSNGISPCTPRVYTLYNGGVQRVHPGCTVLSFCDYALPIV